MIVHAPARECTILAAQIRAGPAGLRRGSGTGTRTFSLLSARLGSTVPVLPPPPRVPPPGPYPRPPSRADGLTEIVLPDQDGHDVRLGDLWADRPAALVWLRHYG